MSSFLASTAARAVTRAAPRTMTRSFSSTPQKLTFKRLYELTPVETYPLIALVGSACCVGITVGFVSMSKDKTLRVYDQKNHITEEWKKSIDK